MQELNAVTPFGFKQVYYHGQDQDINQRNAAAHGIDIVDDIYQYLISDALYLKSCRTKIPLRNNYWKQEFRYDQPFSSQ